MGHASSGFMPHLEILKRFIGTFSEASSRFKIEVSSFLLIVKWGYRDYCSSCFSLMSYKYPHDSSLFLRLHL